MRQTKFVFVLLLSLLFFLSDAIAYGPTHPSLNTFAIGGPYGYPTWPDTSAAFFEWLNTHIDWQLTGGAGYYQHYNQGQSIGKYLSAHSDYKEGKLHDFVIDYFQNLGIHIDSAFAHWQENTYHEPSQVGDDARLVPGWDPINDPNGDCIRNYPADYGYNNEGIINFTVGSNWIYHPGKSWPMNEWQNDYIKMWYGSDYGQDDSVLVFTCSGNSTDTLYVYGSIPSKTYRWYIVDDASAPNHDAVAMIDTLARVTGYTWTREHFNIANDLVKACVASFASALVDSIEAGYAGPSCLFVDDCFASFPLEYCGIKYGGTCLEGLNDLWFEEYKRMLENIKDSVSPALVVGNTAEYRTEEYDTLMMAIHGNLLELWIQAWRERYVFNTRLETVKRRQRLGLILFQHCTGWGSYIGYEREKIFALATYYLTASDSIYYLYNTGNQYGVNLGDTTKWWYGLMSVDMGTPLDTCFEFECNGDYIWQRDFTNGLVLVKPKPTEYSNYTDSVYVNLGDWYYNLNSNGDPLPPESISGIWLKNAQGAVLVYDVVSGINHDIIVRVNPCQNTLAIYPTICHTQLNISFELSNGPLEVTLKIYNASGRLVKSFNCTSETSPLVSKIIWKGDDNLGRKVSTGVYFVELETKKFNIIEKAILLK